MPASSHEVHKDEFKKHMEQIDRTSILTFKNDDCAEFVMENMQGLGEDYTFLENIKMLIDLLIPKSADLDAQSLSKWRQTLSKIDK